MNLPFNPGLKHSPNNLISGLLILGLIQSIATCANAEIPASKKAQTANILPAAPIYLALPFIEKVEGDLFKTKPPKGTPIITRIDKLQLYVFGEKQYERPDEALVKLGNAFPQYAGYLQAWRKQTALSQSHGSQALSPQNKPQSPITSEKPSVQQIVQQPVQQSPKETMTPPQTIPPADPPQIPQAPQGPINTPLSSQNQLFSPTPPVNQPAGQVLQSFENNAPLSFNATPGFPEAGNTGMQQPLAGSVNFAAIPAIPPPQGIGMNTLTLPPPTQTIPADVPPAAMPASAVSSSASIFQPPKAANPLMTVLKNPVVIQKVSQGLMSFALNAGSMLLNYRLAKAYKGVGGGFYSPTLGFMGMGMTQDPLSSGMGMGMGGYSGAPMYPSQYGYSPDYNNMSPMIPGGNLMNNNFKP